jgi:hypothetical protein
MTALKKGQVLWNWVYAHLFSEAFVLREPPGRLLPCTYLDLPRPHADVKAWLREGRWALKDSAVVEGKSRSVPRASNRHIVELSVGERATEMCAAICERMDTTTPSDQHDWYTSNIHPLRCRLSEFCFG